jgi:hypothetical protein
MRFSALPVLMDPKVHCAAVLDNHTTCIRLNSQMSRRKSRIASTPSVIQTASRIDDDDIATILSTLKRQKYEKNRHSILTI